MAVVGRAATVDDVINARSVVVVGASSQEGRWGYTMTQRIIEDGYIGDLYLVNIRGGTLFGRQMYRSLEEVPAPVDVALVTLDNRHVVDVVRQCGEKQVKGIVLYSAGFAEVGEDGRHLQEEVVTLARQAGIRIIGPNCNGIFNAKTGLNLTGNTAPPPGSIALVSQSGNIGLWWFAEANRRGVGLSHYFSVGNAADLTLPDYVEFVSRQDNVALIVLVLEGLRDARRLLDIAQRTVSSKPILAVKLGTTPFGVRAALTHTASIAGSYEVFRGAFDQVGILMVESFEELIDAAEALAGQPVMRGRRVALVGGGGGHATAGSDALFRFGLEVATLASSTQDELQRLLPPWASTRNPVEFAGGADHDPRVFAHAVRTCLQDPNVDGVLIFGLFGGYRVGQVPNFDKLYEETARMLVQVGTLSQKPIVMHSIYANVSLESHRILRRGGIPVTESLGVAARCLLLLADYPGVHSRSSRSDGLSFEATGTARQPSDASLRVTEKRKPRKIDDRMALELIQRAGMRTVPGVLAVTPAEALHAAEEFGQPVALRISSPQIVHRRRAGGIVLGAGTPAAVINGYEQIIARVRATHPDAEIDGVWVSPMVYSPLELALGAFVDQVFGPVIMCAVGGPLIEQLRLRTFRVAPVNPADAKAMIRDTGIPLLLRELVGDREQAFQEQLEANIVALSEMFLEQTRIEEVDLNPVFVANDGMVVGDVRLIGDAW